MIILYKIDRYNWLDSFYRDYSDLLLMFESHFPDLYIESFLEMNRDRDIRYEKEFYILLYDMILRSGFNLSYQIYFMLDSIQRDRLCYYYDKKPVYLSSISKHPKTLLSNQSF